MTRRRLLGAAVGAGIVLAALPALAEVDAGSGPRVSAQGGEAEALALLHRAVSAGRELTYSGTQYVASWRKGSSWSALVDLRHDPVTGSVVTESGDEPSDVSATAVLDPRMLARLAGAYALEVAGPGRCAGRAAAVVAARRPDGALAGRFWVDRETGVLLRRDVYDDSGRRVRSSAFIDVAVGAEPPGPSGIAVAAPAGSARPTAAAVERLRSEGWHVPQSLPDGFRLFETRVSGPVLHLAYTDGLSTLSLFAQRGRLGSSPMKGFSQETVDGAPVWVRRAAPERVVWSGGGRVWTLVSDAPDRAVRSAVAALPRDRASDEGLRARLSRGLDRLGEMLNPFG